MLRAGSQVGEHVVDAVVATRGAVTLATVHRGRTDERGALVCVPASELGAATALRVLGRMLVGERLPHLAEVREVLVVGEQAGFVTSLPAGRSLAGLLAGGLRPTAEEVAVLARALAEALAGLHTLGVAHGAVCPEVVWFRGEGLDAPVLLGCGLGTGGALQDAWTAPEQRGAGAARPVADVFALGRLIEHLLGREPTGVAEVAGVLREVVRAATAAASDVRPQDGRRLAELLDRSFPKLGARYAARAPTQLPAPPVRVAPPPTAVPADNSTFHEDPEDPTDAAEVTAGSGWEEPLGDEPSAPSAPPPPSPPAPAARPEVRAPASSRDEPQDDRASATPGARPWWQGEGAQPAAPAAERPAAPPPQVPVPQAAGPTGRARAATWSSDHGVIRVHNTHEVVAVATTSGARGAADSRIAGILAAALALAVPIGWRLLNLAFTWGDSPDPVVLVVEEGEDGPVLVEKGAEPEPEEAAEPAEPTQLAVRQHVDAPYELIPIRPAKESGLGTPKGEPHRRADEAPLTLTVAPFRIGRTEVTQGLYARVMGVNPVENQSVKVGTGEPVPCETFGVGDDLPVFCVTWFEAVRFANRLSNLHGLSPAYEIEGNDVRRWPKASGYRLPTEAEWEVAARAGASGPWGALAEDALCAHVVGATKWTLATHPHVRVTDPLPCDHDPGVRAVGSLAPTAWGVHDQLGNVAEWVWDAYGEIGVTDDPDALVTQTAGGLTRLDRVVRGGSWASGVGSLRPAARSHARPGSHYAQVGFRLVVSGG